MRAAGQMEKNKDSLFIHEFSTKFAAVMLHAHMLVDIIEIN